MKVQDGPPKLSHDRIITKIGLCKDDQRSNGNFVFLGFPCRVLVLASEL